MRRIIVLSIFHPVFAYFLNVNQMTLTFDLNIHKLLTSVIWEAHSMYQAGQTEHAFHCKML